MPSLQTSFYICAHQDDWIFFRGEWAYGDLEYARSVIIFTTAGDGCCGEGWWYVREQAALAAVRAASPMAPLMVDLVPVGGQGGNTHLILNYTIGKNAVYCLRLPDGCNDPQSLTGLKNGEISSLEAVDHSTAYSSWQDLCSTLSEIVRCESGASPRTPWINAPLYKSTSDVNPGDHEDHTATGLAVQSFATPIYNRAWWWGYSICRHDAWRLADSQRADKCSLFGAYRDEATSLVRQNGNPPCSTNYIADMGREWNDWGPYSHAELHEAGEPDGPQA